MATNGNTFKLMFWVMSGVCVVGLLTLTNNVIANDKLSRGRDDEIKECIHTFQREIIQRLTRIETKIESKTKE